jgi:hypothetical protein
MGWNGTFSVLVNIFAQAARLNESLLDDPRSPQGFNATLQATI